MDAARRQAFRGKAQGLKATVSVGKGGASETVLEELSAQLKKNHLVKVKLQTSSMEELSKKELAEMLASSTKSELVEIRGNTAVLYKR